MAAVRYSAVLCSRHEWHDELQKPCFSSPGRTGRWWWSHADSCWPDGTPQWHRRRHGQRRWKQWQVSHKASVIPISFPDRLALICVLHFSPNGCCTAVSSPLGLAFILALPNPSKAVLTFMSTLSWFCVYIPIWGHLFVSLIHLPFIHVSSSH